MTAYELLYLTPLFEREEQRAAATAAVQKSITAAGGEVIATREFARQRLAYPIARRDAGEYVLVDFRAPGTTIAAIAHDLRIRPEILRSMVTVKNEKVRTVGAAMEAMERARAVRDAKQQEEERAKAAGTPEPQPMEDLDQRLEEILGKEMV